jgi:hypothetical protein
MRARRLTPAALAWLLATASACGTVAPPPRPRPPEPPTSSAIEDLDGAYQPLRARFERDSDLPRIVVLASPS